MSASRPNSLLVLLVVVPLALLAWLGVSLHRDSESRIREATNGIIRERLQIAESHLVDDLRAFVANLDSKSSESLSAAANAEGEALWVTSVWLGGAAGNEDAGDDILSTTLRQWQDERQRLLEGGEDPKNAFTFLSSPQGGGWSILGRDGEGPNSHLQSGLLMRGLSTAEGEMIYWRAVGESHLLGAQLKVDRLMTSLTSRGAPPWLMTGRGTVLLLTEINQAQRYLGDGEYDVNAADQITLTCAPPLTGLRLSYIPGPSEFPSATLFPILLGATSGSLLVPSLAWLFFRENRRELQLAQQRVSFVNQVSHELKTPLTNIRLYAEMVRARAEEADDKVSIRQLTVVESETARLSRLIQNVLNFARKQRERLSIQPRQFSLSELVENVAVQWRPILVKRGIGLHLEQPDQVEVEADPDAVEQILGNLLSNIEKYAADGCSVRLAVVDEMQRVVVSVEDKGPGIPLGKQEFIFEPFERLRSDLREGVSGTGIGLTISRELARLHGGELMVDPTYSGGARFVLTLPLKPTRNS